MSLLKNFQFAIGNWIVLVLGLILYYYNNNN